MALQNRFDCLANKVNLEDMWDNFKQTVTDVSMEVLGKHPQKLKEQWLSERRETPHTAAIIGV